MKSSRFFIVALVVGVWFVSASELQAQKKSPPPKKFDDDTLIVFQPARPFIEKVEVTRRPTHSLGLNIVFSSNGFALGGFYGKDISRYITTFFDCMISGRQNSDEIEVADWRFQRYIVPEKVNRLFVAPFMVGATYTMADFELMENVKPFLQVGMGPALIIATPYIRDNRFYDFFSSFGEARVYPRLGGFVGAGIRLPTVGASAISNFTIRYYVIPFGGDGLESMNYATTSIVPIKDFGGLFFAFTLGLRF